MKTVVIFGGAGYVGKHIIRRLAKNGYKIIIPHQTKVNSAKLRLLGTTAQIIPIKFKSLKENKIQSLIHNSDVIFNLKTMWDQKNQSFPKGILDFNTDIVESIKKSRKNTKFVFFSGLGVDENKNSDRSISIYKSEEYIKKHIKNCVIIRPGIIIGGGDKFLKGLLPLFKISFFIPLFGNGVKKFQPVFIDDISIAINKIIYSNMLGKHTFEFVGNETFTYKDFYNYIASCFNKTRVLVPLPLSLVKLAVKILEKTPISPLNSEQVKLFESDNLATNNFESFSDLDINPQDIREVIKNIIKKIK